MYQAILGLHSVCQITVEDVNQDGRLEMITTDTGGVISAYSPDGSTVWESQLTGATTSGTRVADINKDGKLEVVFNTDEG